MSADCGLASAYQRASNNPPARSDSRVGTLLRQGAPYSRHAQEMPLQGRILYVTDQLHTVGGQAHALKRMISHVARLVHLATF